MNLDPELIERVQVSHKAEDDELCKIYTVTMVPVLTETTVAEGEKGQSSTEVHTKGYCL